MGSVVFDEVFVGIVRSLTLLPGVTPTYLAWSNLVWTLEHQDFGLESMAVLEETSVGHPVDNHLCPVVNVSIRCCNIRVWSRYLRSGSFDPCPDSSSASATPSSYPPSSPGFSVTLVFAYLLSVASLDYR